MSFEAGDVVGPYTIVSTFGSGVYTTEYLATRHEPETTDGDLLDLHESNPQSPTTVVLAVLGRLHIADVPVVERFDDVAVSLKWADCDSTAQMVGTGRTDDGVPWAARAWNDRGTLHDRIRIGRGATTTDLRRLVDLCAAAVTTFDELGLACREVHPTSVLLHAGEVSDPVGGADLGLLWEDDHLRLAAPGPIAHGDTDLSERIESLNRLICEAALGRHLTDEETIDDVEDALAEIGRSALADALTGALTEDSTDTEADAESGVEAARRAMDAWRDRVAVALSADELALGEGRRAGLLSDAVKERLAVIGGSTIAIAIAIVAVGLGLWSGSAEGSPEQRASEALAFAGSEAPQAQGVEASPTERPRANIPDADAVDCVDPDEDQDLGAVELFDVTDRTVTIGWEAVDEDLVVRMNGRRVAKAAAGEDTLMIDRLKPDTLYVVEVGTGAGRETSVVCAQTFPPPAPAPNPNLQSAPGTKVITAD